MSEVETSTPVLRKNKSQLVPYENFSHEWIQLWMQENFDGFRLESTKFIAPSKATGPKGSLAVCHSLFLGTSMRDSNYIYQFGPNISTANENFALMARMCADRTASVRMMKKFGPQIETRCHMQSCLEDDVKNAAEFTTDYYGNDYVATGKLAWQGSWILSGLFSQMLRPNLHLGSEFTLAPLSLVTLGSFGIRYVHDKNHVLTGQLSRQPSFKDDGKQQKNNYAMKLQYYRKVSDRFALGSELMLNLAEKESVFRIGWEYTFRNAKIQNLVDTCGRISMFVQEMNGIGISGIIDYWNEDYRIGLMMALGPQEQQPPQ